MSIELGELPDRRDIGTQELKNVLETILKERLGKGAPLTNFQARHFYGKLSIYPEAVDESIDYVELRGKCALLSFAIRDLLRMENVEVVSQGSSEKDYPCHIYDLVNPYGNRIIIDPSIGQIIKGHNHVFVGTEMDLRNLVLN